MLEMMTASFNHITLVLCLCGMQFGVAYSNPAKLPAMVKSSVLQAPATGCVEVVHDDYRVYVCDGKSGKHIHNPSYNIVYVSNGVGTIYPGSNCFLSVECDADPQGS